MDLVCGSMVIPAGGTEHRRPGSLLATAGLRRVPLAEGFAPELELLTGAFAPRGRRSRVPRGHPLALLWAAFEAEVEAHAPGILAI